MFGYLKRKLRAFASRDQAVILTYHSVIDTPLPFPVWQHLERERFEEQIALIAQSFHPVSMAQLLEDRARGKMQPHSVAITFDDGFRNNLTVALPILRKYQVPMTLFATTAPLGTDNLLWPEHLLAILAATTQPTVRHAGQDYPTATSHSKTASYRVLCKAVKKLPPDEIPGALAALTKHAGLTEAQLRAHPLWAQLRFLSWEEIREMKASGLVEIGAHTVNHWRLTHLPDARARQEIDEAKTMLEKEAGPIRYFAYPHGVSGDYSETHRTQAVAAGYEAIFTALHYTVTPKTDPTAVPRLGIGSDMSLNDVVYLLHGGLARMER